MKVKKKYGFRFYFFSPILPSIDIKPMIFRLADGTQCAGVERFFDFIRKKRKKKFSVVKL